MSKLSAILFVSIWAVIALQNSNGQWLPSWSVNSFSQQTNSLPQHSSWNFGTQHTNPWANAVRQPVANLQTPARTQTSHLQTAYKSPNQKFMACCKSTGVPSTCVSLCNFDTWQQSMYLTDYCPINSILSCANGRRDHTHCCQSLGVQPLCLQFCSSTGINIHDRRLQVCQRDIPLITHCLRSNM